METHSEFIDALGGAGAVATVVGYSSNRVSNWRHRGVPWQWRAKLAEMAREKSVPLPAGFLDPTEQRKAS
jgi:hypothetical protein